MNELMRRLALGIALLSAGALAQSTSELPLIPYPASLRTTQGSFHCDASTHIRVLHRDLENDARIFADGIERLHSFRPIVTIGGTPGKGDIVLDAPDKSVPAESYALRVTEEGVHITGGPGGLFYGLQTLRQLVPLQSKREADIPCLEIRDAPRYPWRGMHLDVCRHFFSVDVVKRYIDELALYKMNTFHWHLTDDQGWRIEIRKYPRLTHIGGYRKGSMIGPYSAQTYDTLWYGGYYTQDQIRDVVAYAKERHVTIVPEIEMPGHALAALAAYPELSCTGGPFEVAKGWGVFDDILCPKEETFRFLENVLAEVCDLFPGPRVHIGGDEAPKIRWKNCSHCQELIRKEGLKDESGLQSFFTRRIERFLNAKGKQLVGWDEILEGGLAPNATVMSWRGTEGGVAAAKLGHDVIMTPGGYCYFDYYQGNPSYEPLAIGGYTTVEKTYSFEPTPAELSSAERVHILGAQGNVWTEYITSPRQVEYMAIPRMAALAEVDWSPDSVRRFDRFRDRLLRHFAMLDSLGVNYAKSIFEVECAIVPEASRDGIEARLSSPLSKGTIRYTVDGSPPTAVSKIYSAPVPLRQSSVLRFGYFEEGSPKGPIIEQPVVVSHSTGRPITLREPPHANYPGNGALSLVDGLLGDSLRFGNHWIAWSGKDMDATVDLGKSVPIASVRVNFFEAHESWIYLPKEVELYGGNDSLRMRKL